jgi:hypothetical protein
MIYWIMVNDLGLHFFYKKVIRVAAATLFSPRKFVVTALGYSITVLNARSSLHGSHPCQTVTAFHGVDIDRKVALPSTATPHKVVYDVFTLLHTHVLFASISAHEVSTKIKVLADRIELTIKSHHFITGRFATCYEQLSENISRLQRYINEATSHRVGAKSILTAPFQPIRGHQIAHTKRNNTTPAKMITWIDVLVGKAGECSHSRTR